MKALAECGPLIRDNEQENSRTRELIEEAKSLQATLLAIEESEDAVRAGKLDEAGLYLVQEQFAEMRYKAISWQKGLVALYKSGIERI